MMMAMVRMRLTSTASMMTIRKAGNRGGCPVVISGYSFRSAQCAGRLSSRTQTCLRRRQLLVDRQDARQPAEREESRGSDADRNADLCDCRCVGFPVPHTQAYHGYVQPVE